MCSLHCVIDCAATMPECGCGPQCGWAFPWRKAELGESVAARIRDPAEATSCSVPNDDMGEEAKLLIGNSTPEIALELQGCGGCVAPTSQ